MIKEEYFDSLIFDMGNCKRCIELKNRNGKDCSLINIYEDDTFAKKIPSIWTDWYNRINAKIIFSLFLFLNSLIKSYTKQKTMNINIKVYDFPTSIFPNI